MAISRKLQQSSERYAAGTTLTCLLDSSTVLPTCTEPDTGAGSTRMTAISQIDRPAERVSEATRWTQLIIGIICMVMIANLQYGWTLFTIPISQKHGWNLASIQVAFTLFVLFETWLVPFEGYLVDRMGPRI